MSNKALHASSEFFEIFGTVPDLLSFDETMYDIDLSIIISSI